MKNYGLWGFIVLYFIVVFSITKPGTKDYNLSFILDGLGKVPAPMLYGFLSILVLGVIAVFMYRSAGEKGGKFHE
ncbi:MAG: hypothetical protein IKW60_01610 [Clostridia bacterium]|nr:hypothetical protein [Clostridia bacterium]